MTRVNARDLDTARFCLVGDKAEHLRKAPTMESALCVGMPLHLRARTNVGQVLKHNRRARRGVLHDAFGEDMIVIFALPKQFTRKFAQMFARALGAFGLQRTTETEDTAFLLFPTPLSQKRAVRGHRWTGKSQIDTYHLIGTQGSRIRKGNDNMQAPPPLTAAEISRTDFATDVVARVLRDGKVQLKTSSNRGETARLYFPLDTVEALVIANRATGRARYARLPPLFETI